MNTVADLTARVEERARDQLAVELDELQRGMLRSLNAGVSRAADHRLCTLLMILAARILHDETITGSPFTDAEKWNALVNLLGHDFVDRAGPAVRALLKLKSEAHEANG